MVKKFLLAIVMVGVGMAQTSPPPSDGSGPSYFATTGVRYNYYDKVLTETTNFGVKVTGPTTVSGVTMPNGFWSITSIDATPRSQASSAGLRESAAYFISKTGNFTFYTHMGVGAQTNSIPTGPITSTTSLLGNMDGGLGVVWSVCRTFNPKSNVNCIATFDYSILAISSQSVKPVVGFFIGTSF